MKLSVAFVLLSSAAFAAAPIGVATASGQFRVEGSRIWGNSTLFDGSKIETSDATSELSLSNGVKVQLSPRSSARVWKGHLDLERGSGFVIAPATFQVNAGGMIVEGQRYRVDRQEARMQVAAFAGNARVLGDRGSLLAAVPAGSNKSFAMQQTVTRTGCLVSRTNGFLFQVDNSAEVLQLVGGPLAENVGNRVMVTGALGQIAPTISPATLILNVTSLLLRSTGGCLTVAAALNAQTSVQPTAAGSPANTAGAPAASAAKAPPTIAKTGMSTGAKVAIIGAVAGGGAGAALALGGKKSSTSP